MANEDTGLFDRFKKYWSEKILGHKDDIIHAGKKLDAKIREETAQLRNVDGFGEYLATNMTTVLSTTADKVGMTDLATKIEGYRGSLEDAGKKFDQKLDEEYRQYKSIGGIGEYVSQNMVSLLSQTAQTVGMEQMAQNIESHRTDVMNYGKKFDKKLDEEYQQYKSIGGIGEYVSHNMTSLLSQTAQTIGMEQMAQDIESHRTDFMDYGKKFDKKLDEEVAQFKEMNSPFKYFSGNILSVLEKASEKMHLDRVTKLVRDNRQDIEKAAENIDERMKKEYHKFKQSNGIGEYLANDIIRAGEKAAEEEKSVAEPQTYTSVKQNISYTTYNESTIEYFTRYDHAEIKEIHDKDGSVTEVTLLDGVKHGLEIKRDKDGSVHIMKLFDHGLELDMNNNKVELFINEASDGSTHTYALLNGEKFGTERLLDKNGELSIFFNESNGLRASGNPKAKVTFSSVENDAELRGKFHRDTKKYQTKMNNVEQQAAAQHTENNAETICQTIENSGFTAQMMHNNRKRNIQR